jgi:hypothetical protein
VRIDPSNPISLWLIRVAQECGSPAAMLTQASQLKTENSRKLVTEYALHWDKQRRREADIRENPLKPC